MADAQRDDHATDRRSEMMTDLEVKELIGKLNSSGDSIDKDCAKMLQQMLNEIEATIASGVVPVNSERVTVDRTPENAARWERLLELFSENQKELKNLKFQLPKDFFQGSRG
jgi:hypothetical protein